MTHLVSKFEPHQNQNQGPLPLRARHNAVSPEVSEQVYKHGGFLFQQFIFATNAASSPITRPNNIFSLTPETAQCMDIVTFM